MSNPKPIPGAIVCQPRILLVGVDADVTDCVHQLLKMNGHTEVATANSIKSAIGIAQSESIDLLISLARVYPGADARDMLRALRAKGWTGQAILTTANAGEKDLVADCKRVGFAAVLPKPVKVEKLLAAITACLTSG